MHLAEGLAVHFRVGDDYALRNHRLVLCLGVLPLEVGLWANERLDGLGVSLGAHDVQFVANFKLCVLVWQCHLALVQDASAYYVASEKLADLRQCATREVNVAHLKRYG